MIEECKKFLPIEDKEENLKSTWRILNKYTHFTYTFIEITMKDPEFIFVEKVNKELFRKCFEAYFTTVDFFYSVLCWRFPNFRRKIKKVIDWWNRNFDLHFTLTERTVSFEEKK